jgi:hypothetical protein
VTTAITTQQGLELGRRRYAGARLNRAASFRGLPVRVEIEVGERRSGVSEGGTPWSRVYSVPYGEVSGTRALSDGDPVDCYLGPSADADVVYVVHQLRRDGSYDEDKCMLGFPSEADAVLAYRQHGPEWGLGSIDRMTFDQFKHGYLASNRRHR